MDIAVNLSSDSIIIIRVYLVSQSAGLDINSAGFRLAVLNF